jgi:predicted permease
MPDWREVVRQRVAGLGLAPTRAEEIVEELGQHLEDRFRELRAAGTAEAEAERAVLADLAAADVLRDALCSVERPGGGDPVPLGGAGPVGWLRGLGGDFRYALRALRRSPGLSATVVATLAVGIGANAAIFSVVDAALLRPLPFAEPERLVAFWGTAPEKGLPVVNYPDALYVYFRTRSRTMDPIAAYDGAGLTLTGRGEPERLEGAVVTADFFRLLGRPPLLGRTFLAEEEAQGRTQVAVLGYGLWQRRFGGDPTIVGSPITLNGAPGTVVGVMPPGFDFPNRAELWVPLATDPQALHCWCYTTVGRLAPGTTPQAAAREIALLTDDVLREREGRPPRTRPADPGEPESRVVAEPLSRQLVGPARTPLLVLLGAVGMVLLIACANVANVLLARSSARGREIAVRCCLGASPWRIMRQLLVESLMLALAGAALGLGLAALALRALERVTVEHLPHVDRVGLDLPVLAFTLAVTLITVLLFGLAPALRGARLDMQPMLKDGARGTAAASTRRLNHAFVVVQFALSLVLLAGAGLLLRSFRNLLAVDPGFRADNVLVGRVALPDTAYTDPARARAFFDELVQRVSGRPGVTAVGLSSTAPFSQGNNQQPVMFKGQEPGPDQPIPVTSVRMITPGYFAAVGTRLLRGRAFEDRDRETSPRVAIIDETLARRYFPDGDAIGHEVRLGGRTTDNPWRTVVGVVPSVKHRALERMPDHYVYLPQAQYPRWVMDVVVRAPADPGALAAALRADLRALDGSLPLYEVHTLEQAVARSLGPRRLTNVLLLAFALTALLLAALGIYGVMAVNVGERVTEFGIRLALGAVPRDVLALVLGQGLRLVVLGAAVGFAGAVAVTRLLGTLLFDVKPVDPVTFAGVGLVLAVVALAACYIPARRATATDPLRALRYE